jgi:hypothetical protein
LGSQVHGRGHSGGTGKDPGANGHLHGVFKCHLLALEIACLKA